MYKRQQTYWHVWMVAPKQNGPTKFETHNSRRTYHIVEHPTHCGPAPPQNTQLTVVLPHPRIPYSPQNCPTTEHHTHCGPTPPRNTLLILDLPNS